MCGHIKRVFTHTHTHAVILSGSYTAITVYSESFTVRNNVKHARPPLSPECTSEATLHRGSAALNAPPAGSLATSRCLLWQSTLCQPDEELCRGFRAGDALEASGRQETMITKE